MMTLNTFVALSLLELLCMISSRMLTFQQTSFMSRYDMDMARTKILHMKNEVSDAI